MATTYSFIASNKRKSILLVVFFAVFILVLGWFIDQISGSGTSFLIIALAFSLFMTLIGYFAGDSVMLWTAGATKISSTDNPYVYRLVENLCITTGLPVPAIYLIPDPAMNAFATGRDPKHASLALTTGIVEGLENEELEGVIAHELSHIGNFDIRFMMLVGVLVGLVAILSDTFVRSMFWGGRRGSDNDNNNGGNAVLAIVGIIFIVLSPIIGRLIQLAVSRKREFLADASGALVTRYPEGLASALRKIGAQAKPLQKTSNATAHLYFSNPFGAKAKGLSRLFSTHPPIEERIKALEQMSQ